MVAAQAGHRRCRVPEARAGVAQVVAQHVLIGVGAPALDDAPLLHVDDAEQPALVLDAIDVVGGGRTAHAAQLPPRGIIGVCGGAGRGRHALRQAQVVVGDRGDVVPVLGTVQPGFQVAVGVVGVGRRPRHMVWLRGRVNGRCPVHNAAQPVAGIGVGEGIDQCTGGARPAEAGDVAVAVVAQRLPFNK